MDTLPQGYLKIGAVSLIVSDLDRSTSYYQEQLGLRLQERSNGSAVLGVGQTPLVRLRQLDGARPARGVTGLYHFALLLPSRRELARVLSHFTAARTPLSGAADHLVSEAIYLSDPDGHGIEIYRDRPRQDWYNQEGVLMMDTLPLDIDGIIAELDGSQDGFEGLPENTVMGHMHLHVSNLSEAEMFYTGLIGLDRPRLSLQIPSARFLGAGGYHHHLGLNTWAGEGAGPPAEDAARLLHYEILFPNHSQLETVLQRLDAALIEAQQTDAGWLVRDPAQNGILLRTI